IFLAAALAISGRVIDPSGAGVPHATVTLRNIGTVTTDDSGRFSMQAPSGRYRLEVSAGTAFSTARESITVPTEPLTIQLALAKVAETVEVNADDVRPSVDTTNLDSTKLSGTTLEQMPVFDQDLIGALTPLLDPSSIATAGPTIIVDGVEMKGIGVARGAIDEITINEDPYAAESNRPGRGRIEVTTKPAGGDLHGTFNFTFRDAALATTNYFAATKPPGHRTSVEGTLTGHSFLFSFSQQTDDSTAIVHAIKPSGLFVQNVPAPSENLEIALRGARDWNEKHHASLQLNYDRSARSNRQVGGLVLPEAGVNTVGREAAAIFNLQSVLNPAKLNQFQLTLEFDRDPTTSLSKAPALIVRDAFTAGGAQSTIVRTESGGKISDAMTLSRKNHTIKFGIQVPNVNRRVWDDQTNQGGTYSFANLSDYIAGRPYAYVVQQGEGHAALWFREYGAFAQDQIKVSPRLSIVLGARYDWTGYFHDTNNWQPRMSFAWGARKGTVVRGGAGTFYDRAGVAPIAAVLLHNGSELRSFTVLNPSYPNPPAIAATPVDITRIAPDIQIPHTNHFGMSVEQRLNKSAAMTIGYRGSRGYHQFRSVDINALMPPDYATIPDPRFGHIQQFRSDGRQRSDALEVSFRGKVGKTFTAQAQYTLAKAMNNTGGIFWYPANMYAPADAEWGRADFDQRHRLSLIGTIKRGNWLQFGVSARFNSGLPYSETAGQDLFHTGLSNARPLGVARNAHEGRGTRDVDVRWAHDIALTKSKSATLSADIFNLLNHPNFSGYVGNIRSPLFGLPTTASAGRRLQLSVSSKF
ncbi:MAG: TonB-dependent receptor, partial [Acidobacteriota bacterium]|nr:TonB-dependent receptor [Acidobacteriota bacterium]